MLDSDAMTGDELKLRREQLGLSQPELAAALGIPQPTIARWETGALNIRHGRIIDYALRYLQRTRAPRPVQLTADGKRVKVQRVGPTRKVSLGELTFTTADEATKFVEENADTPLAALVTMLHE